MTHSSRYEHTYADSWIQATSKSPISNKDIYSTVRRVFYSYYSLVLFGKHLRLWSNLDPHSSILNVWHLICDWLLHIGISLRASRRSVLCVWQAVHGAALHDYSEKWSEFNTRHGMNRPRRWNWGKMSAGVDIKWVGTYVGPSLILYIYIYMGRLYKLQRGTENVPTGLYGMKP